MQSNLELLHRFINSLWQTGLYFPCGLHKGKINSSFSPDLVRQLLPPEVFQDSAPSVNCRPKRPSDRAALFPSCSWKLKSDRWQSHHGATFRYQSLLTILLYFPHRIWPLQSGWVSRFLVVLRHPGGRVIFCGTPEISSVSSTSPSSRRGSLTVI